MSDSPVNEITKVLVANRGEIAVRVMRACRDLGIETAAIYSEADRTAPHVRMADEAYCVGPAAAQQSYLDQQAIIGAATDVGADAVHPGYGFLSENPAFARTCREAGLMFIGPPASAIEVMGDKTAARAMVQEAGVPVVPGSEEAISDAAEARRAAEALGYPVLIKAAAGGGGKGMRVVEDPAELSNAMEAARRESESAFGDSRIFLERYLERPRHIEFQIVADSHGNTVHLFERECSIQRRHQKVIEEAPSPFVTPELRETMGEAAIRVAERAEYVNAGTVEFIVAETGEFYFLEMNTRLQVEHPVTEATVGIDLVAEQIRVAGGAPLSFAQEDVAMRGHAIESRIYAEDPANDFLPDAGTLRTHRMPAGPGVRIDAGVEEGMAVGLHYDPMISKLITWAPDRHRAIARMKRALDEYEITGVRSTIPFCRYVMDHDGFAAGDFSTRFIPERFDSADMDKGGAGRDELAAIAAAVVERRGGISDRSGGGREQRSARDVNDRPGWRSRRSR